MALTASFVANFESFYAATQKATAKLTDLQTGAGRVEAALNRMGDAYSGRKTLSEATLAAKAVEDLGGASKLTRAEQDKLNGTITEALAKYKALGLEAPKDMIALADATKKVDNETGKIPNRLKDITGVLTSVASAVGIGFSIGAVVSFGKSVFDSASKIHDMAEQLGISASAAQGFKFAADQSGSSIDAVGIAITKMNQHLSAGDTSTVKVTCLAFFGPAEA